MAKTSFENICIFHILDGLRDGLSHFSQASRAALIYAETPGSPPRICDPQDLLSGHEPKLQDYYLYSNKWRSESEQAPQMHVIEGEEGQLDLSGIISLAARSKSMHYQAWFTDQHPDMCSTGPTKQIGRAHV